MHCAGEGRAGPTQFVRAVEKARRAVVVCQCCACVDMVFEKRSHFWVKRTGSHLYSCVSGEATVVWEAYFTFAMGGVGGAVERATERRFDGLDASAVFYFTSVNR